MIRQKNQKTKTHPKKNYKKKNDQKIIEMELIICHATLLIIFLIQIHNMIFGCLLSFYHFHIYILIWTIFLYKIIFKCYSNCEKAHNTLL